MSQFSFDGPEDAPAVLLLAHGAGAPMDAPFMNAIAAAIAGHGLRVARFEFGYMAQRRQGGRRLPPPRAERLEVEFLAALDALAPRVPVVIGGKSLGGRVASMVADRLHDAARIAGLVCLGYPFHPPGRADQLRTAHLEGLRCPALICQGERDPFGTREEVSGFALAPSIRLHWLADGDHDFTPRRSAGVTHQQNLSEAAAAAARFIAAACGP